MKSIKTMAVGAIAATLLLGTAGLAGAPKLYSTPPTQQPATQLQQDQNMRITPSEDWSRGVQGQDSDVHGTSGSAIMDDNRGVGGSGLIQDHDMSGVNGLGGSGLIQDNSVSGSSSRVDGMSRVGSGGTGDLDRNQQGDLRGSEFNNPDNQSGIGGAGDTTKAPAKTKAPKTKGKNANTTEHGMGEPKNATGTSTNATGANEGVDKNPTQPNPKRDMGKAPTPAPAPTP